MSEVEVKSEIDLVKDQTVRMTENLVRVHSLLDLYDYLRPKIEAGKKANPDEIEKLPDIDDVLRSATVILHATLEDFLRAMANEHIPRTEHEFLKQVPIAGVKDSRKTTFSLSDLVNLRGKQVDEVIDESIDEWLHKQSYNSSRDIAQLLLLLEIDPKSCDAHFESLNAMIVRRHRIVHNVDRIGGPGLGLHPISRNDVKQWSDSVLAFVRAVFEQIILLKKTPA